MLELSDKEKVTTINMLRALLGRVDNTQKRQVMYAETRKAQKGSKGKEEGFLWAHQPQEKSVGLKEGQHRLPN